MHLFLSAVLRVSVASPAYRSRLDIIVVDDSPRTTPKSLPFSLQPLQRARTVLNGNGVTPPTCLAHAALSAHCASINLPGRLEDTNFSRGNCRRRRSTAGAHLPDIEKGLAATGAVLASKMTIPPTHFTPLPKAALRGAAFSTERKTPHTT